MKTITRREFLGHGGVAFGASLLLARSSAAFAYPLAGLLGLQANDIRTLLAADYDGTLRTLAGYGYKALDLVGLYGRTAKDVRQSLDAAGMVAHNSHYSFAALTTDYDQTIADAHVIGLKSIVCQASPTARQSVDAVKKFGEEMSAIGRRAKRDGILIGYHNHTWEFTEMGGQVPFDVLVTSSDPEVVKFQLDVGSAAIGGSDPIMLLAKYPTRYYSLHVRDVKDGKAGIAVGEGTLDFRKIFGLAKAAGVRNYDVETGAPAAVVMDKMRLSAEYLRALTI